MEGSLYDNDDLGEIRNPYASPTSLGNEAFGLEGEFRPFQSIWTSPRLTIRRIVSTNPELHVLLLIIWGLIILCNTIAEVQGFYSAWRGLGNLLLSGAVVIIPLIALVFVIVMLGTL